MNCMNIIFVKEMGHTLFNVSIFVRHLISEFLLLNVMCIVFAIFWIVSMIRVLAEVKLKGKRVSFKKMLSIHTAKLLVLLLIYEKYLT